MLTGDKLLHTIEGRGGGEEQQIDRRSEEEIPYISVGCSKFASTAMLLLLLLLEEAAADAAFSAF